MLQPQQQPDNNESHEEGIVTNDDQPIEDQEDQPTTTGHDGDEEEETEVEGILPLLSHAVKIVKVVPLTHARSEVWSYFGFIADDDGEIQDRRKVICKICATTLSYSGNTTNLFTHLKAMHPEANPQKGPPTNRNQRLRSKDNKRRLLETVAGTSTTIPNSNIISIEPQGNADSSSFAYTIRVQQENSASDENNSKRPGSDLPGLNGSASPSKRSRSEISTDDITNFIVEMLVKDCRPVSLVEGKGFQDLLKLLAPDYKIPDEKTLTSLVNAKYNELRHVRLAPKS